jgi:DNA-binding transcriptional regulator YiaG
MPNLTEEVLDDLRISVRRLISEKADAAQGRLPDPQEQLRLRNGAGLSQRDLASLMGVTRVSVSYWERGRNEPSGENRTRYVAVMDELQKAERKAA